MLLRGEDFLFVIDIIVNDFYKWKVGVTIFIEEIKIVKFLLVLF